MTRPKPSSILSLHPLACRIRSRIGGKWQWPVSLWLPNLCTCSLRKDCSMREGIRGGLRGQEVVHRLVLVLLRRWVTSYFMFRRAGSLILAPTFYDLFLIPEIASIAVIRVSSTGLLLVLSHLFRRDYRVLLLLLELDIASHWLRIYCEVMSKKSHCSHLENYQNFLYIHPLFRLFCALSQEVMYITLYLFSFELLEQNRPARLDVQTLKHSKYWKIIVVVAPGYIMRLIATLDEIRLATSLCFHFDNQPSCLDKVKVVIVEPSHVVLEPCPVLLRRRKRRNRSLARSRSRSRCKFDPDQDIVADF